MSFLFLDSCLLFVHALYFVMPSDFTSSLGPTQMADAGGLPQLTQVRTYYLLECLKCEQQSGKDVKNSVLWADIF